MLRLAQAPKGFEVSSGDEGGALSNGASHSGDIPLGDLDQWSFTANAGSFIHLAMATTSGSLNPQIRLLSPTGEVVDVTGSFGDSRELVVEEAPMSGTYRVIVSAYQGNNSGEYVLTATW